MNLFKTVSCQLCRMFVEHYNKRSLTSGSYVSLRRHFVKRRAVCVSSQKFSLFTVSGFNMGRKKKKLSKPWCWYPFFKSMVST